MWSTFKQFYAKYVAVNVHEKYGYGVYWFPQKNNYFVVEFTIYMWRSSFFFVVKVVCYQKL